MTTTVTRKDKTLHIILWICQGLLATGLLWAASVKLIKPVAEVAAMWPWAGQVPVALLRFTGVVDLLGGVGLILPLALNIKPRLTAYTAICVTVLMLTASVFHIVRGEANVIVFNIIFGALAAFVAWGRLTKVLR